MGVNNQRSCINPVPHAKGDKIACFEGFALNQARKNAPVQKKTPAGHRGLQALFICAALDSLGNHYCQVARKFSNVRSNSLASTGLEIWAFMPADKLSATFSA